MLICQISDLHVRAPGEVAYGRVDTAGYVRHCVSHILAHPPLPDIVVVTGDLTDRGQPGEYAHLAELLAPLAIPTYLIPGNHDDRDALRAAFPSHTYFESGEFINYALSIGPMCIIGLDTVVPGMGEGLLCAERLRWLEQRLDDHRDVPTVVLMHHPPFETGISYMDQLGLRSARPLEPIMRKHSHVERILCGHLHRTIFRSFGGTIAVTCPSPAHQVVLDLAPSALPQFAMEPPGYLLHRWTEGAGTTTFSAVIGDYDGPYPFYENGKLVK